MHENSIEFEITAPYALFSDPVTRVGGEKCTYSVPTYEALKGVVHSIYWKPTIIWIVDKVRIMNKIRTETKGIRVPKDDGKTDLSYYNYLRDCRYRVKAHFEWNLNREELKADRNENKHFDMARRSLEKGGRRDIFLGARECQAYVAPCSFSEDVGHYDDSGELSLGTMYHGLTYPDEAYSQETRGVLSLRLFRAVMREGVIEFPRPDSFPRPEDGCVDGKSVRVIRKMSIKPFGTPASDEQKEN